MQLAEEIVAQSVAGATSLLYRISVHVQATNVKELQDIPSEITSLAREGKPMIERQGDPGQHFSNLWPALCYRSQVQQALHHTLADELRGD